jgi:ribosomal protein S12 methylthiotransferase
MKKQKAGRAHKQDGECEAPVVGMISLGCAKNTVDTERILGMLAEKGFAISADPEWADVVVVNTCAFIAPARTETEKVLREVSKTKPVVAVGCYPERMRPDGKQGVFALDTLKNVAAFVSFEDFDKIPDICASLLEARVEGTPASCFDEAPRLRTGSHASAYLKIAEGCDNRCRYCALPDIRGPLKSRPLEKLVDEARQLIDLGARELCVIAQDTGLYGKDLYGEVRTARLLRELARVDGLNWIRLLYMHPRHLTDEIVEVIATEQKVCTYVDLPIQHASAGVLAAMGRGYDGEFVRALVEDLRRRVEGIALRTSIIVGFPGETDRDFEELLAFVREVRFDNLGAFEYSPEKGTPAHDLPNRVPRKTARSRRTALMAAQQAIAFSILDGRVGGRESALLEYGGPEYDSDFAARTYRESPEVDGRVYVEANNTARLGDIVDIEIVQRQEYDLVARIV